MRVFPQLGTGATGQYPIRRVRRSRTVENSMADGKAVRLSDSCAEITEWRLEYSDLTDPEMEALAAFFYEVEGRLGTFTFLDPAGNLAVWSEQLDKAAWEKGPMVSVSGGIAGPGGENAWRVVNAGAVPAGVMQVLAAPEGLCYCTSVWARSEQVTEVALVLGARRGAQRVGPGWGRLVFTAGEAGAGESTAFGLEIEPGGAVDVFGFQVEAQPGASGYKKTGARGGVYANARLGSDELRITTEGPGRHGCTLSIIHGEYL